MRKNFGMLRTFLMGSFVALTALLCAGCEAIMPAVGIFENQTRYTITVTIAGSSFGIWSEETQEYTPSTSASFSLYANATVKIQSSDHNVDFRWTTSSAEANRAIYVVNNGSKVTFKE
jgi:hypothetical protein